MALVTRKCNTTASDVAKGRPAAGLTAGVGMGRVRVERDSAPPTLCLTLSSESGVSMEKPIKMTCAFEYASGRNRS